MTIGVIQVFYDYMPDSREAKQRASQHQLMDDQSALLNQLRIDRGSEPAPSGKAWIWLTAAFVVLAAAGIAVWWWTRPSGVPVHIVDGAGHCR